MEDLRVRKTGSFSTRTWFNSLRHAHEHIHICSVTVRGLSSPQTEQPSMLNFDPSHYLPRRWGWGWGDNLWTLTFNPEAWGGPCQDNLVSVCTSETEENRQNRKFEGCEIQTWKWENVTINEQQKNSPSIWTCAEKAAHSAQGERCNMSLPCRCPDVVWGDFCTTSFSQWPFLILHLVFWMVLKWTGRCTATNSLSGFSEFLW